MNEPKAWQASQMHCGECVHEWVAVHPIEEEYLQCPVCDHMNPAPFIDPESGEVKW
jgi:hypothetical protein